MLTVVLRASAFARLLLLLMVAVTLLSACGGGGVASDGGADDNGRVSVTLTPTMVSGSIVQGESASPRYAVRVNLDYQGSRNLYLGLRSDDGLAVDYALSIDAPRLDVSLGFNVDKAPGTHRGELQLIACYDTDCRERADFSPIRIPLQLEVLPNLQVAPEVTLSRAAREPAPTLDIPVSVPAAAGEVVMTGGIDGPGLQVQWLGNALRVTTAQFPAGTYTRDIELTSRSNPRYHAATRIIYRVDPPPGGEKPLRFVGPAGDFALVEQGQTYRQRWQLQGPTWTDSPLTVTLNDPSGRLHLQALGNSTYEVSFDATGLALGTVVQAQVNASALPWGGAASIDYRLEVSGSFSASVPGVTLDGSSTAASLTSSGTVRVGSGPPARWTARSLTPWVRLRSSSGTTGVDALTVDFDATTVLGQRGMLEGSIEVAIDRAGTQALRVPVSVENRIPALGPGATAALLPGSGHVYLDGLLDRSSGVDTRLQVDGASLGSTALLSDPRFIGDLLVMRVDLQGLTAGRTVTLRSVWPLLASEVRIPVVDVPRVPAGFVRLPLGAWRSAQWSLRQGALYFAADGVVARWALGGGAWSLATASVPGVADVALFGPDTHLIAAGGTTTWRLHASTLALLATGRLPSSPMNPDLALEALPPATSSVLSVAADGAPLAAIRIPPGRGSGAGMLTVGAQFSALTGSSAHGTDPGSTGYEDDPGSGKAGVGLVRSANGEWIVGTYPSGRLRVYQAALRSPDVTHTPIPAGRSVRAVSDDGQRLLLDDGRLLINGTAVAGSLAALVPTGFEAGGYGLSGSGRYAFVYLYRVAVESGVPRARDAALWTVNLDAGMTVAARQPLADAVGCNAAPSPGEACTHQAQVAVAPGDGSVFVLGPRGVAALPVAAAVTASRAPDTRRAQGGLVNSGVLRRDR